MNSLPKTQHGLTFISLTAVVALIVSSVLLFLKLYPPYYGYFKVSSAVNSLSKESGVDKLTDKEIKDHLLRRLQIDDVDEVDQKHIVIEKSARGKTIRVAYEIRVPIVGNLDAVTRFDKSVELGGR